ncbi:hypothetical protein PCURB6_35780 [Paenibacillus curdlanolyticus]|nr:hypothetical protein PCURB6_35780 [Paenibacillus curdlanolyticus]
MSCSVTIGSCEGKPNEADLEQELIKRYFWVGSMFCNERTAPI